MARLVDAATALGVHGARATAVATRLAEQESALGLEQCYCLQFQHFVQTELLRKSSVV